MTLSAWANRRLNKTRTPVLILAIVFYIVAFDVTAAAAADTLKKVKTTILDLRKTKANFSLVNDSGLIVKIIPDNQNVRNTFYKKVIFRDSHFSGMQMMECTFKENISFTGAAFLGGMDMSSSIFEKTADFSHGIFNSKANFYFTKFQQFVDFWDIKTTDTTTFSFYYAQLPDLIDFSGIRKLHQEADFTVAHLTDDSIYLKHRWHYINLFQTDPSFIRIDYSHFRLSFFNNDERDELLLQYLTKGKSKTVSRANIIWLDNQPYPFSDNALLFSAILKDPVFKEYLNQVFPTATVKDSVVGVFVHHWLQNANFPERLSREQTISVYERVLKNFDTRGQKESYENLDIQYRNFKNGWWVIPYIWYCYGYHKEFIFYWTIFFLVLFTFITSLTYPALNKKVQEGGVYHIENINDDKSNKNAPSTKLWKSFFYTATIFFLFSLKVENVNFRKTAVIYVLLVYFTGLLCLGYLANFILQK